jgi:hypothetical protein
MPQQNQKKLNPTLNIFTSRKYVCLTKMKWVLCRVYKFNSLLLKDKKRLYMLLCSMIQRSKFCTISKGVKHSAETNTSDRMVWHKNTHYSNGLQHTVEVKRFKKRRCHLFHQDLATRVLTISSLFNQSLKLLLEIIFNDKLLRLGMMLINSLNNFTNWVCSFIICSKVYQI